MQIDWMSTVLGFLAGTAVGAAGGYCAEKFTDQRRKSEYEKSRKKTFLNTKKQMLELIAEIKADLSKKNNGLIRQFFVLEDKKVCFNAPSKPHFIYYEDVHPNLRGKLDILENQGLVIDITSSNIPKYRMTEEFVELIHKYG